MSKSPRKPGPGKTAHDAADATLRRRDFLASGAAAGAVAVGAVSAQPAQAAPAQQSGGIDLNMLLNAGMAFFQARQQGAAPVDALVQAVMAGSQMQSSAHHSQSGQLVAGTLLNAIGSMLSKPK